MAGFDVEGLAADNAKTQAARQEVGALVWKYINEKGSDKTNKG